MLTRKDVLAVMGYGVLIGGIAAIIAVQWRPPDTEPPPRAAEAPLRHASYAPNGSDVRHAVAHMIRW